MTHDPYREHVEIHERGPLALFMQIRRLRDMLPDATRDQMSDAVYAVRENIEAMESWGDDLRNTPALSLMEARDLLDLVDQIDEALDQLVIPDVSMVAHDLHTYASEIFPVWALVADLVTTRDPREAIGRRECLVAIAQFAPESAHDIRDALSWCEKNAPWAHLSPAILWTPRL